jgi:hypothetical protein
MHYKRALAPALSRPSGTLSHRMGEGWGEGSSVFHAVDCPVSLSFYDDIFVLDDFFRELQCDYVRPHHVKHGPLSPKKSPRRLVANGTPRNEERWMSKSERQPDRKAKSLC